MDVGERRCKAAGTVYEVNLGELEEGDAVGWLDVWD